MNVTKYIGTYNASSRLERGGGRCVSYLFYQNVCKQRRATQTFIMSLLVQDAILSYQNSMVSNIEVSM